MSQTSRTSRDRWRRVEEIYVDAVEREGEARIELLDQACQGDAVLRQDVESLLACSTRTSSFIERPALEVAATMLTDSSHAALVGRTIGPYAIEGWLGSGGMGDVYRARDSQLNRPVALKVLPDLFAVDRERLDRFKREAQVLAALNHPNIAAIHGFEHGDGVQALALEFVDGSTLAAKIAGGPIPVDEVLPLARQLADGLEAAHEQGIVHRDLKPSNIAVRHDGMVKILDFGLAKVLERSGSDTENHTPSEITHTPAIAAVILGTPAYMSPEQAKGRPGDKRSDIWAFGAVLYEMLSGRRPFRGEGTLEILAAVINQDVDWSALPTSTPPAVRRLIARCLDRDVRQRLRDIGEARIVLENTPTSIDGHTLAPRPDASRGWRRRSIGFALVAILTAAVAAFAAWQLKPTPALGVTRFALNLPAGQVFSAGTGRHSAAISRDGLQVVYSGVPAGLYRRSLSQLETTLIQGSEDFPRVTEPVFSPDGRSIAFYTDGALKRIAATGGAAVTIAAADAPYGISWEDDGTIVFGQGSKGILRVPATGGVPDTLVRVDEGQQAHGPHLLPGGEHVLFTLASGTASDRWNRARIVVQSLVTGDRTVVVEGGSDGRLLPTGHLIYALAGALYAAPFDASRRVLTGPAVSIVDGVSRANDNQTGAAQFSVSDTGTLIYIPGPSDASLGRGQTTRLGLIDRNGVVERLPLPPDTYHTPRVSPDGTRIAFVTDDGKEAIVWIYDLRGNTPRRRLTFGGNNRFPLWSADGAHIVFQSDRGGDAALFAQASDGSGNAERLTTPSRDTSHVPESWSPHGEQLLYGIDTQAGATLWLFSMTDRTSTPFGDVRSSTPIAATFSPDGRWVAYASTEGAKQTVYVQPFPATGAKHQLVAKGVDVPSHPVWSPNGKELFYNPRPFGLEVVGVSTTPVFSFGNSMPVPRPFQLSPPEQPRAYDVTPAGKFVARLSPLDETSGAAVQPIQIVVHWFEELRTRVPVSR